MKKYLLVGAVALLTTAGVTATVLGSKHKKTTKETNKHCPYTKSQCSRAAKTACY
jgi:hypothetical protein